MLHALVFTITSLLPGPQGFVPSHLAPTSAGSCRACHRRIYDEWSESAHARSFTSPLFQRRWMESGKSQSCLSCHASRSVFETGLGVQPKARGHNALEGVNCASCHRQGEYQVGPHSTPNAAHPTIKDGAIRSVGMCASCHDTPCEINPGGDDGQVHDYLHAPQRHRETCQSCHMSRIEAKTVSLVRPFYPARTGRSHWIKASRDPEVLRKTLSLETRIEGKHLELSITNTSTAHRLPGNVERSLILETRYLDRKGLEFDRVREYLMYKTKTRLRAGETRYYEYFLKPHYEAVETKVWYRLFDDQPKSEWTLIDRVARSIHGPRPVPETPSQMPNLPIRVLPTRPGSFSGVAPKRLPEGF